MMYLLVDSTSGTLRFWHLWTYIALFSKHIFRFAYLINQFFSKPREKKRVLVIRLDELGDLILSLPSLHSINKNHIDLHILTHEKFRHLICDALPNTTIHTIQLNKSTNCEILYSFVKSAAKGIKLLIKFDYVIIPRVDLDRYFETFLSSFTGAKVIGYTEHIHTLKKHFNKKYDTLLDIAVIPEKSANEVIHNFNILKEAPIELNEKLTYPDFPTANTPFIADNNYVILGVDAREEEKMWTFEGYMEIANRIHHNFGLKSVIIGERKESNRAPLAKTHLIDLRGKTSLLDVANVISNSILYIGNDTGVKHLAAWSGKSTIEIFRTPKDIFSLHPQSSTRFSAWGNNATIISPHNSVDYSDLHDAIHCYSFIHNISVDEVWKSVKKVLTQINRKV